MRKRRRFTEEFKQQAVALASQPGMTKRQVADDLSIDAKMLGRWCREQDAHGTQAFPGQGKPRDEEIAALRRTASWDDIDAEAGGGTKINTDMPDGNVKPTDAERIDYDGKQDLTTHVDLSAVQAAAHASGCETLGLLDQTYFLLGLASGDMDAVPLKTRLALKTLLMPGGLGSTLKVLIIGKGVGRPALRGCSFSTRLT